jgi:hypothetical protein
MSLRNKRITFGVETTLVIPKPVSPYGLQEVACGQEILVNFAVGLGHEHYFQEELEIRSSIV